MGVGQTYSSVLIPLGYGFVGVGGLLVAIQLLSSTRGSMTHQEYGRLALALLAFAVAATCFSLALE